MDNKIPNMDYDADEVINEFKEKIKWPKSDEVTAVVKPSKILTSAGSANSVTSVFGFSIPVSLESTGLMQ